MTYKRTDSTQTPIVEVLRKMGMSVYITSSVGFGFPDLVASWGGRTYLIELKNGTLPPSGQKLTTLEKKFHETWQDKVHIINSVDAAVEFVNSVKKS